MTQTIPHWTAALYGVLAASAILIGGGLSGLVGADRGSAAGSQGTLAAVGAGFLVALGAVGALPEALHLSASPLVIWTIAAAALGGMLWLHRFGHPEPHAHGEQAHAGHGHGHGHGHGPAAESAGLSLYDARMAVWGLALHSLLDGVAVSAALASQHELGVFVAIFVLLHKLPEGAAAAALTYASGGGSDSARRYVMIVAAASLIGAFAIFVIGPVLAEALALTAGVTVGVGIGIASHLRKHGAARAFVGLGAGASLFAITEWLLHG